MISDKWRHVTLGELVEIEMGQSPKSEHYNTTGEGLPFLQGNRTFGEIHPTFDTYCTDIKKVAQPNDVLMSVRAPVGDLNIAQQKICIGRGVCAMRMKNSNNRFLFYLLKHNMKSLINRESGTVFGSVNKNDIMGLTVRFIDDECEQNKIANVLTIIDEKIVLNNKIISNLEQLSQTIFKHWFIDFEFPNEEGLPYKSSGGKMVDSELGEIPDGWYVSYLDKIANYKNGLAMQKYRPTESEGDSLPVLKIKELNQGFVDNNSDRCSITINDDVKVYEGDVIFSWSGTLLVKLWTGGNAGLNQHLFKVTSNEFEKWFYYLWTNYHLEKFKSIAADKATTMGHIKRTHLAESEVIIADSRIIEEATKILKPLIDKIILLGIQNRKLSELRENLLPKLLSGEIEIPDESVVD